MHRSQFIGQTIRHLRRMALAGAAPDELEAFLEARSQEPNIWAPVRTLGRVFLQGMIFAYTKRSDPAETNALWSRLIEQKREEWQREPVPELMRLRDYFAFMQFCQQENVTAVVVGANPAAGQWIGASGVGCYDGSVPVLSRVEPPFAGLLAADPTDARLAALLAGFDPPIEYATYVERLAEQGLRVAGANEGYVVEDRAGRRLHEAYRLLGLYQKATSDPAWTPANGERLRTALNRHLGRELVLSGPHDAWEYRNDRHVAGPLTGPLLPALEFSPNQEISEILTLWSLESLHPYAIRWNELFPDTPSTRQS
jgi:hypothetical protein